MNGIGEKCVKKKKWKKEREKNGQKEIKKCSKTRTESEILAC